jgi:hypothetical protein
MLVNEPSSLQNSRLYYIWQHVNFSCRHRSVHAFNQKLCNAMCRTYIPATHDQKKTTCQPA